MARAVLLVFALFAFLVVLRGLRIFFDAVRRSVGSPGRRAGQAPPPREADMIRDPVCGTWIDRGLAVSARRGGETVAVCSETCRRAIEGGS
jgi:YHS domain-containing protein